MGKNEQVELRSGDAGVELESGGQSIRCDFVKMLPRLRPSNLAGEMLVRAARIKNADHPLTVVDATAGFGEDSLLLAAAGFNVTMFERNPTIAAMLRDAMQRANQSGELAPIVARMTLIESDSVVELPKLAERPNVVYLDPMFPAKVKNSLAKKKFQLLHLVELPCEEEQALLDAAIAAHPQKIVIKRPIKGDFLGGRKPDYSIKGKSIRYDCLYLGNR